VVVSYSTERGLSPTAAAITRACGNPFSGVSIAMWLLRVEDNSRSVVKFGHYPRRSSRRMHLQFPASSAQWFPLGSFIGCWMLNVPWVHRKK